MLVSLVNRPVSFIMAAKSVRRPIIGHIARAIGVIPVERPQVSIFSIFNTHKKN